MSDILVNDLHIHTVFSDGICSVEDILKDTDCNNYQLGISDHIFCKKLPNKSDVLNYIKMIEQFPVLKGGEIDLGEIGIIDDYVYSGLDYLIGSIHNIRINGANIKLGKYFDYRDKKRILNKDFVFDDYMCCKALDNILKVIEKDLNNNSINILGHCTVNPFYEQVNVKYRYQWENEVISICKKHGTAIEISGLWIEPEIGFICRVIKNGVKLSFGSDCHREYSNAYWDYFNFANENIKFKNGDLYRIEK